MNYRAVYIIYITEVSGAARFWMLSIAAPVVNMSLYFVVFGSAIGSRISEIEGVPYGAFIVPGLVLMTILSNSTANGASSIYIHKAAGTIYEYLTAPVSGFEIALGHVGAAATKSITLGLAILAAADLFVPLHLAHPLWMLSFMFLTATTFSLLGFVIGIWADSFQQLQLVPVLIVTPLSFLGGSFYSIKVLPPAWQVTALFDPIAYLISGFRWSFYGIADVSIMASLVMTALFLTVCLTLTWWIFRTGYKLRQ